MDIQTLNDNFRKSLLGGKVMLTRGIFSKGQKAINEILDSVKIFNNFNSKNDPYNEHDYGSFVYNGQKIMWKIDYYDRNLQYYSDNPADITKTIRVMTVMLAEEYQEYIDILIVFVYNYLCKFKRKDIKMADKYVIQIAKEGGAESCDKFKNLYIEDIKDIVQTNFKIDKIEDINDSNYSTIIKSINEHLNDEKYKNFKKLSENKNISFPPWIPTSFIIIFLSFSDKDNCCINWKLLFDSIKKIKSIYSKNEKLEEKIKEIIENFINQNLNSNFIVWKEFCHIEGASQDNVPCMINNKRNDMNRLFITNENFDKNTDILCFMNININAKDGEHIIDVFKYEEVHLCKDNY